MELSLAVKEALCKLLSLTPPKWGKLDTSTRKSGLCHYAVKL